MLVAGVRSVVSAVPSSVATGCIVSASKRTKTAPMRGSPRAAFPGATPTSLTPTWRAPGGGHDDQLAGGHLDERARHGRGRVEALAQRPLHRVGRAGRAEGEDGGGVQVGEGHGRHLST